MLRYLTICLVLVLSLSVLSTERVQACSGGAADPRMLNSLLTYSSVIISGRINSISESGINVILEVEYYLKGVPENKFLLYERSDPRYIELAINSRPHPIQCMNNGSPLPSGRHFFAGLGRANSGSYSGLLAIESEDGLFDFYDPDNPEQTLIFDYEGIVSYATQRLNETLKSPQINTMPRPAATRIITDLGNEYLIPVDQNIPVSINLANSGTKPCGEYFPSSCINRITAPNGVDVISLFPTGTGLSHPLDRTYALALEGEVGVFSHRSDLFALWANEELQVYVTIAQTALGAPFSEHLYLLQTLAFDPADSLILGAGAWSPNGRTFAFSAASGVWLWDALTPDAEPTLFFPADDEPVLVRHFSPAGNYLALETNSRRFNIDIASRQEYVDGLFSPDDRILAAYDTAAGRLTPLRLYTVLPEFTPFLGWYNSDVEILQFEWVGNLEYVYAACGDDPEVDISYWCKVFGIRFTQNTGYGIDGVAFDYEPTTGTLATQIDGDTITINGEIIELGDQIDGSIIHIKLIPLIDLNYRNF